MKLISKIIYFLLQIFSFGLFAKRIKKKHNKTKSEITFDDKIGFNVDDLVKFLGGTKNIDSCDFTVSRLKIKLKSTEGINVEEIGKLKGISGVVVGLNEINLIVGNKSKAIWKAINNFE
ncbi:PTS transporter subunit EIIB [Mesomycoplasma ovipneumoniae]|uniref:PTS transporter subunit EIIB n=1 Tax=Mesomycoplasma ovipneumoniae TaxID=29562 RepID=UPI00083E718C|nr:PTS transporter subunit EIIB [Mesomycoplasma ovipneumoniae]MDO6829946.1 PTS transporter subunit EIIB [Mesomycoplasma ovipneumoniae]WDV49036.1 PTS transporter subunit EIIB [Mesomycoplasma ovipneumoniae ATCC 29419]